MWVLLAQQNTVKTANLNSRIIFLFVTGFYSLDNICMVGKKILWQDLLFFRNLRDAPDASIALVDYERHTFYHHHRSVETQCLWLVDTYLADKSVESHQQVLLAVAGTLRIIYAMNDDESEIARYSVLAKRRIGAS